MINDFDFYINGDSVAVWHLTINPDSISFVTKDTGRVSLFRFDTYERPAYTLYKSFSPNYKIVIYVYKGAHFLYNNSDLFDFGLL